MRTALTIAGSDSSGGAGVQADLKAFAAHHVHGVCAITAVTAQNTVGITTVETISPEVVTAQIEAVLDDFDVRAVKTGMLATRSLVAEVCGRLEVHSRIPVVVDPVMISTSGHRLLDDDAVELVRTRLLPRARVVTPNRLEAEALTGHTIGSLASAAQASARLRELGATAVVITGGHFDSPDAVDFLDDGSRVVELRGPRVEGQSTHGTGCTFAASIAAGLARGVALADAVAEAKRYIEGAIRHALPLGRGPGIVNHFWNK